LVKKEYQKNKKTTTRKKIRKEKKNQNKKKRTNKKHMNTKTKLGLLIALVLKTIATILFTGITGNYNYAIIFTIAMFVAIFIEGIILWGKDITVDSLPQLQTTKGQKK
jgi:Na+/glutamate symporter